MATQEFAEITQHETCRQLLEWLGQQFTGVVEWVDAERQEWMNRSTHEGRIVAMSDNWHRPKAAFRCWRKNWNGPRVIGHTSTSKLGQHNRVRINGNGYIYKLVAKVALNENEKQLSKSVEDEK